MSNQKEKKYLKKNAVRNLLKQKSLTQKEFCQMIDLSSTTFSSMMSGKYPVSKKVIENLCDLLQTQEGVIVKVGTVSPCHWNDTYLKQVLLKKGITISKLSKLLNINKSNFSAYRRGTYQPSIEMIYHTYQILGCDVEKLTGLSIQKLNTMAPGIHFPLSEEENAVTKEESVLSEKDKITHTEESNEQKVPDVSSQVDLNLPVPVEVPADIEKEDIIFSKYKEFEDQNILSNLKIVNGNLLTMVEDFANLNVHLVEKIDSLERKVNLMQQKIDTYF